MEEKTSDLVDIISKILFGVLGSLVIGYLFFQQKIFNIHYPSFIFITIGIYGSVFFSLTAKSELKKQILILISVIFLDVIIMGKPYHFLFMIRDTVMILIIFFSIKTYISFINKNKNIPLFLRAFGLSIIYAAISILGITFLFLLNMIIEGYNFSFLYLTHSLLINAELVALVGLGLGLGFDTWEFIKIKYLKEKLFNLV
jgi:hypothetical protein